MQHEPIQVLDRYTGNRFTEAVYGDRFLRFAYDHPVGRIGVRWIFSRLVMSRLYGWWMRRPSSARRIQPFIATYEVDESSFNQPASGFKNFNEFFRRELKDDARPVDPAAESVVFPADGRHLGWDRMGTEDRVFAKGQSWDLESLLGGDARLVKTFAGGALVLSRLCPTDYHHFHYPVAGRLHPPVWMGRRLYSVSPIALRRNLAYLWENRRCFSLLESEAFGQVGLLEIGATHVGTIRQVPVPENGEVEKGGRKGWFEFGGSSVITLFEPGRIHLSRDLQEATREGIELYAHVGDVMGWRAVNGGPGLKGVFN